MGAVRELGKPAQSGAVEVLFRDFVLPVASPEIAARIVRLTRRNRLEGFPLLHLDFYKDDPVAPDWATWLKAQKLQRTDPNRGIRYQRISTALDAVLAEAGFTICGLALIAPHIDDGSLLLPFPIDTGSWTEQAYLMPGCGRRCRFRRRHRGGRGF